MDNTTSTPDSIPVINLDAATGPDNSGVVDKIADACDTIGFFGVTGHGVSSGLIADIYRAAAEFFSLPESRKLEVERPREGVNRGYLPIGSEALARLRNVQTPSDHKEVYTFGPEDYPDDDYHTCEAAAPHWVRNQWPTALPGFRATILRYWDALDALAHRLAVLFARALGLHDEYFASRISNGPSQLRLIHYPPYERDWQPSQLRAGEHTDLGLFGILHSDSNNDGGLQVKTRSGAWQDAPTFDGFIVNIGDAMMRWTNDRFRSTPHRVVNPARRPEGGGGTSRMSVVYFPIPNYDVLIDPITQDGSESHYQPVTMGEYRAQRFASTATTTTG
jgi:isopenicillin N synthase-like dioxygenase